MWGRGGHSRVRDRRSEPVVERLVPDSPVRPSPDPPPVVRADPEPFEVRRTRQIAAPRAHAGRRQDRRTQRRVVFADRLDAVLETVGMFRVVSRRSLVNHCFDGHPFSANRGFAKLEAEGLLERHQIEGGRYGYDVFSLSHAGRERLRRRSGRQVTASRAQRYWVGVGPHAQLRHDHQVFEAVAHDSADIVEAGGRVRRVRIEAELRGLLASAGETARRRGGPEAARQARAQAAAGIGLRVFEEEVPLPDALVELEREDGSVVVRSIEVATGFYTSTQVRAKEQSGFRVYRFAGDREKRRHGPRVEEFPLAWGR